MNNVKYAIDDLMRKPFIFLITILQIIVAVFLFCNGLSQKLSADDMLKRTENMFNNKQAYRLMDITSEETSAQNFKQKDVVKKVDQLYNFLTNNKDFTFVSCTSLGIFLDNFSDNDKFYCSKDHKYMSVNNSNSKYSDVKANYVDETFTKQFPMEVSKGRVFSSSDFTALNEMPVILGAGYEGYYKVGDKLRYYDSQDKKVKSLKVIGILKSNYYFFIAGSIINLDNYIICPCQKLDPTKVEYPDYEMRIFQSAVITNNKNKTLGEIRDKNKELNLYSVDLLDSRQYISKITDGISAAANTTTTLSIIILLFTCIGIITSLLNSIEKRYAEFGIHMLAGASINDIGLRIFYSIVIYIGLGVFGGVYLSKMIYPGDFDIRVLYYIVILSVILIALISFLPLSRIRKMEVSSIMRRKE